MNDFLRNIWEEVCLFFKQLIFTTLTDENREKIVERIKGELRDIEVLEKQELQKIKDELIEDLTDYHTDEEIEDIYQKIISSEGRR